MPWSPSARAEPIARSATGRESPDRPASMRLAARPAWSRALDGRRREQPSTHARETDRLLQQADGRRRVTGQPGRVPQALPRPGAPLDIATRPVARIDHLDRAPCQVDRPRPVADQERRATRRIEKIGQVPVGRSVGGRDQVPGVDRVLVLAGGLRVPVHGPRGVAGDDGRRKRLGRAMPQVPVMGDLHEAVRLRGPAGRGSPAHRLGICGVEPSPLRRQESLVGRFLGQRVPEPVALDGLVGVHDQELRFDRLAQSRSEIVLGQPAHLGEDLVVDVLARHRRDLDDATGLRRHGRQAHEQHVPQRLRQALPRSRRFACRGRELLGEEGVPVGPPGDRIDERRCGRLAGDPGQQCDELGAVEASEVDPVDSRLALGLGQPRRQRMASVKLVRPEGADDEQTLGPAVAREVGEQVARGAVCPVEVLHDEEDGPHLPEAAEQPQDPLEDADLEPFATRVGRLNRRGSRRAPAPAARARRGSVLRRRRWSRDPRS